MYRSRKISRRQKSVLTQSLQMCRLGPFALRPTKRARTKRTGEETKIRVDICGGRESPNTLFLNVVLEAPCRPTRPAYQSRVRTSRRYPPNAGLPSKLIKARIVPGLSGTRS